MYLFFRRLRILLTIAIVAAIGGGLIQFISQRTYDENVRNYELQITVVVATRIQQTLLDVTRTAEAPQNRFQIVRLGENESLAVVAQRYGSTLEALQIANGFDADVSIGNGEEIVVPVNMEEMTPPRIIEVYRAQAGDTLAGIAERQGIPLSLLEQDNPLLVQRGLIPGDIVFVSIEILT